MNYSLRRRARPRVAAAKGAGIFAFALLATLSNSVAAPANPANGEQLAKRWCASCHIVSADQTRGADNVPSFAAIAKRHASALRTSGNSSWIRIPRCPTCNSRETRPATLAPISQVSRSKPP